MQQHASAAFEQQRGLHVAYLLVTYMHACSLFNSRSPCSSSECMAQCILRQGIIILLITLQSLTAVLNLSRWAHTSLLLSYILC